VVQAEYGEMPPGKRAELEAWLAADRRHRGAFLRARAALYAMEDAVIEARSTSTSVTSETSAPLWHNDNENGRAWGKPAPLLRALYRSGRTAVAGAALLAACAVAMVSMGVQIPFAQKQFAVSEEVVTLRDGSVVTLRHGAKLEVALSDKIRRITLLSGDAIFKVAKDKKRPFVVRSGEVFAQATGTVYSVKRVGLTGGRVKVTEGSVLVWPHDERDQAVLLHAGGKLTLDPGPLSLPTASVSRPRLPPPELAQISLDNVPIKTAVIRFNRVNSTKIVIADPEIGDTEIVGLFKANEPEQFARAAAAISGGRVEHARETIVIKLK
jgi:transmembrane sensor